MKECGRILVVDDDPNLLRAASRLLKRAGYEVIEAATGNDGLCLAKEQKPDLILLDVVLPDVNGLEVCRRIKAEPGLAGSFVILLSGIEAESGSQVEGLQAGADSYIVRPIHNRELLARVQAMVRIQQAEKELKLARDQLELRVQERTAELELRVAERTAELDERVKELNCLYGISRLVEKSGVSLEEIIRGTLGLIPPAWQYPAITGARITLEGQEFKTENFRETAWMQARDVLVHGEPAGRVEVCYLEERPAHDEGPFLKEEGNLFNAIAERLGRIIERVRAEEGRRKALTRALQATHALQESEKLLRTIAANYPAYLSIIEWDDENLTVGFTSGREFARRNLDPDDFAGLALEEVFGEHTLMVREHYLRAFGGEEVSFELYINNQHQLYNVVPLYDESGKVRRILAVVEDITERKRAEEERERLILELQDALARVKTLSGLLPICASCKKIRDDKGYWTQVEVYILEHSDARFTHGICPECARKLYPDYFRDNE